MSKNVKGPQKCNSLDIDHPPQFGNFTFLQDLPLFLFKCPERLVEPSVRKVFSILKDGHCVMALQCSSSVKDTSFSWEPEASFDGSFWRGSPNASVVWTSYSPNRNVTFICTASNGLTNASKVVRETCQGTVISRARIYFCNT